SPERRREELPGCAMGSSERRSWEKPGPTSLGGSEGGPMSDRDKRKTADVEPDPATTSEPPGSRRGLVPRESWTFASLDDDVHAAASGGARDRGVESAGRARAAPHRAPQS